MLVLDEPSLLELLALSSVFGVYLCQIIIALLWYDYNFVVLYGAKCMGIHYSELGETPFTCEVTGKNAWHEWENASGISGILSILLCVHLLIISFLISIFLSYLFTSLSSHWHIWSDLENVDSSLIWSTCQEGGSWIEWYAEHICMVWASS